MSSEYEEPSELFEKPRGERRWLGREHHRGKEQMYNAVKGRTFIEKTFSAKEPMSKKATAKLNAFTKDGLEPNVVYSLDKKNRWRDADTIRLLGAAPEEVNAEVVEKNVIDASTFSVSSRVVEDGGGGGEFGVRRATSSGKGQHYSNFTAKSRELSEKRKKEKRAEEEEEGPPTVSYNIYRTHRNIEVVGGQMFKAKVVGKSGRHRANRKIDMEVYEEEDFEEEEEEELERRADKVMDLTDYLVEPREKKKRSVAPASRPKPLESLDPSPEFPDVLNIHEILHSEGSTFEEAEIVLNMEPAFEEQMEAVKLEKGLRVIDLRPEQYLVDASEWCQLDDGSKDGETTTVIVIDRVEKKLRILVNSTIASNPSQKGSDQLKLLIGKSQSILDIISTITSKLWMNRVVIETMKLCSSFYHRKTFAEMLQDTGEWKSQMLNMQWPNRHYHATWANSQELSTMGTLLEWTEICNLVKRPRRAPGSSLSSGGVCGICNSVKSSSELFLTTDEVKIKCSDCLRDEFYKEMRVRRVPIDLALDVADELEYLPTFIPLPVLNAYVRMVGAAAAEKCPSCKGTLIFQQPLDNRGMLSCPCGFSWCHECFSPPHWPMACAEYEDWQRKWTMKYSLMNAQGSGHETLLQVACSCGKSIYNVRLPSDTMECPSCKIHVDPRTMRTKWRTRFYPLSPPTRKYMRYGWFSFGWNFKKTGYLPIDKVFTSISEIPEIPAGIYDTCAAAHDVRFDVNTRNRAVNKEHVLIRKGVLEAAEVENAMGTVAYLAETVTAWMHVTTAYDRSVKRTLERMMESRKTLVEVLETDDAAKIRECLAAIRRDVDTVLVAVEKKINEI